MNTNKLKEERIFLINLSKLIDKYKLGILQESERLIKKWKENKEDDKFLRFKIGDEFEYNSFGKLISKMNDEDKIKGITPTLNNLEKVNWTFKNKTNQYKYPFYDSSTKNNHISGYSKRYNFDGVGVKVSELGGLTQLITDKSFIGKNAAVITSKSIKINDYISHFLNNFIPKFKQGSTQKMVMWSYCKDTTIEIPTNHEKLSKHIKLINEWQNQINTIENQINLYIKTITKQDFN